MTTPLVIEVIRQAFMQCFWLCLPLLGVGFIAGIVISVLQIVTSIQDSAFGTVPRLAAFLIALFVFLPWMLYRITEYATSILGHLEKYAG
jgi:flagellar biosynthesis protein FliQ